jgi:RNA polymerase sigma-70 factor, ECF subfamily
MAGTARFSDTELKHLLGRCISNDESAWPTLFNGLFGFVKYNALRAGLRDEDVEDAVSETFTKIVHRTADVFGARNSLAYLGRMAYYTALAIGRARRRRQRHETLLDEDAEDGRGGIESKPDPNPGRPGSTVMKQQIAENLAAALGKLTPPEQRLLRLKYVDDWCYEEIGYVLERASGSLRVSVHRLVKRLGAMITEESGDAARHDPEMMRELSDVLFKWFKGRSTPPEAEPAMASLIEDFVVEPEEMPAADRERVETALAESDELREYKVRVERATPIEADVVGHMGPDEMPTAMLDQLMGEVAKRRDI